MEKSFFKQYGVADIHRWFSAHTLHKAEDYEGSVELIDVDDNSIYASVWGSAPDPYELQIVFHSSPSGIGIVTDCDCPVGNSCKHCAAALIEALVQRDSIAPLVESLHGQSPGVSPEVKYWVEQVGALLSKSAVRDKPQTPRATTKTREGVHYVLLRPHAYRTEYALSLVKGKYTARGLSGDHWNSVERALLAPPQFVDESDLEVFRTLRGRGRDQIRSWEGVPISRPTIAAGLPLIAKTGRLWLADTGGHRYGVSHWTTTQLHWGTARKLRLDWVPVAEGWHEGRVSAVLGCDPAAEVLPISPAFYVDTETGEIGPVHNNIPEVLVQHLRTLPPLSVADVPLVADLLQRVAPEMPRPHLAEATELPVVRVTPTPVLRLMTMSPFGWRRHRGYEATYSPLPYDYAACRFRYAGEGVMADLSAHSSTDFVTLADGRVARIERDVAAETARMKELASVGFKTLPKAAFHAEPQPGTLGLESEADWQAFFTRIAPQLREQGWQLDVPKDFRHFVLEPEAWSAEIAEGESGWFDLDMGIVVEGQRLSLVPLLSNLFKRDPNWLEPAFLKALADDATVILHTADQRRIRVPAERVKTLATTLIDLFDAADAHGKLRINAFDAARLDDLTDIERWQFKGEDAVLQMAERLRNLQGVTPVLPPPGFMLELRPYQQQGLAWLQYLGANDLAGILADDMGLGKTAQTLAHLLTEKQAGRLDKPALVVLPTSLIFNWKREAAHCAPDLTVLSLHGSDRADRFTEIARHDVCLTTYPLLWRDEAELAKQEYSWLILDEAQTVKNAASRAAEVVRRLNAQHRLCLTGTPLENHLGELWSQFDFLLPGFLRSQKEFTATWRTPIEKRGDTLRRDLLARRLAPFILRRKKGDVASDLPEKTIIVRTVELEAGQRDLYETVRAAMDVRIRDEIATKGFNRSQIVILDALLKLRQACCDPRLLKTITAAKQVKESAKLELLMEMVPEMVEEGRRILLFSQFTTMIALIEKRLQAAQIPFVTLTGDTRDRASVIDQFQGGDVPVFLISLKAGGVGLNLTAADTVIHYDPWWNPAVENQATDRAHRLGQKNKVFVYKLVVAGSIEEKILELQARKASLAEGVLSEDADALTKFGESDIRALLAPLPKDKV